MTNKPAPPPVTTKPVAQPAPAPRPAPAPQPAPKVVIEKPAETAPFQEAPVSGGLSIGAKPAELPVITLSQEDVQELGRMLYKNLQGKEDLMGAVAKATTFKLEGVSISLDPRLLTRLQSRCFDKSKWEEWLQETVIRQLHDFAGY